MEKKLAIKNKLTRRSLIKTATLAGAAIALSACDNNKAEKGTPENPDNATASISKKFKWKMVTTWPKNFPGLGTGAQRIADSFTSMTNGDLEIKLYAGGELVPPFECFDAVREGKAEMAHSAAYYWVNKHKSAPFFCTVPGGLTVQEHNAWIYHGGGQELWDELYGQFGIRAFLAGGSGVQMGGWFQKEINSLTDLEGIKMRIPGLGAEVINRLGGTAVNMPGGEIMPALQAGVIDATEWVGPWNDLAFGFYKVAKYYYGPGFHEPNSALECLINKSSYEILPKSFQEIVRQACAAENANMPAEFSAHNSESQEKLINQHQVDIRHFPREVIKKAFKISEDIVKETADVDPLARRIFENWWNFRNRLIKRAPYAEMGYMQLRS